MKRYDIDIDEVYEGYARESADGNFVRYEDAAALELRIIELEQKLKTQDELKAEFEKECE